MLTLPPDLYCFGAFKPCKNYEDLTQIGTFELLHLDALESGGVGLVPALACSVALKYGAVSINWESGNPPSAKAGRALDLQRAAAARVKATAAKLSAPRFYWLDAAGKVTEGDESAIASRLRELLALSADLAAPSFADDLRAALFPHKVMPAAAQSLPATSMPQP